jgi:hypothetical protein
MQLDSSLNTQQEKYHIEKAYAYTRSNGHHVNDYPIKKRHLCTKLEI